MASDDSGLADVAAEATTEVSRLATMFRSLRHRDFALFWTGNSLSNIGTWMQDLALGWVVLEIASSPFLSGLNGFLGSGPLLFFSLPGGAIADRLNRRKLMLATQTTMMVMP
jgi:MFS family permease